MSEEESQNTTITTDDLDTLRVLLHNVKGLSAVSSASSFTMQDAEPLDE